MTEQERLYEAFGEMIYTVAIADGYIQPEETAALDVLLSKHAWASEIKWSFDYEVRKHRDIEEVYKEALITFERIGPHPEYKFMMEVMEELAKASHGTDDSEQQRIDSFRSDLTQRFLRDLGRLKLVAEAE